MLPMMKLNIAAVVRLVVVLYIVYYCIKVPEWPPHYEPTSRNYMGLSKERTENESTGLLVLTLKCTHFQVDVHVIKKCLHTQCRRASDESGLKLDCVKF